MLPIGYVGKTPQLPPQMPMSLARKLPRLFEVRWDNSKTRTRDPRKNDKQEAFGTLYTTGLVTLDNGGIFATMGEMRHMLELKGEYEIVFLDEMEPDGAGHGSSVQH